MKDEKFVKYWLDVRSEGKKSFVIKSTFFNSFAILLGLSVIYQDYCPKKLRDKPR